MSARRLLCILGLMSAFLTPAFVAFGADGSGTNIVSPTSVDAASTGNTLTFTFTAAETMNSGGVAITAPSGWSAPQGSAGTAGYTTVSSATGMIANVEDAADNVTGWAAGTACANGLTTDAVTKHEGVSSISCANSNEASGDRWYKNISSENWSGYTRVGFWIRADANIASNRLLFAYDDSADLATPLETINIGALSANTWTYIALNFGATARSSVTSYGFVINHGSALDNLTVRVDDILIGPGAPTFPGGGIISVRLLQLTVSQTVIVTYGSGGGTSGVAAPSVGEISTFTTESRISDDGVLTAIASSPTITVNNPAPTTTSISPTSKTAGDAEFTLTVNGANFISSSVVRFAGSNRATTYINSTQLTAVIPASDLTSAGTFNITVFNPTPGGGESNAQTFTVNAANPMPTTTSISPTSKTAGDAGFTLTVNGTNFIASSVVRFGGLDRATTYISDTQLTAEILASDLTTEGNYNVRVFNPTPGGGLSNAQTFTVNATNPVPATSGISPTSKTAGDAEFTLTINGTNFISSSVVRFAGSNRATTYINSTQLTAVIPASDIISAGTFNITVFNPTPGGGESNAQTFTVNAVPPAGAVKFVILDPTDGLVNDNISVTLQAQKSDNSIDTAYQNDVTLLTSGLSTGGGLVDIVNGVGTRVITDAAAEIILLSLSDTEGTGLDVSSTQQLTFSLPEEAPSVTVVAGGTTPTSITIFGRAYPGAQIYLAGKGGETDGVVVKLATVSDTGEFSVSRGNVPQQKYAFSLVIKDKDGRQTQTKVYIIDLTSEAALTKEIFAPPTIDLARATVTKGDFIKIIGYASPKSRVKVEFEKGLIYETNAKESGEYEMLVNTARLNAGKHTIRAKQQDINTGQESDWSPYKIFAVSLSTVVAADLNNDGIINIKDWSMFLARWKDKKYTALLDLNGDKKIDIADLSIFLRAFRSAR